jgi:hypothetical protein
MTSVLEGHLGEKVRHFPVMPLSLVKNPKQMANSEEHTLNEFVTSIVRRLN